ncbi:alkaline phosphatase PhoX [Streptomyces sp. NPDC059506]|uniref:alkaline phosphatase PhoX n=1 Tax=Streptomyces sp. NPDC059506 TaxID=3347751 RepID=UPI0036B8E98A
MERRSFLRGAVVGGGVAAFGGSLWRGAAVAAPAQPGIGPNGALGAADANGVRLPAGFTSRVIARSGQKVADTSYTWHNAPDGGACFADGTGWIYVSNSEISLTGGAGAVRFDSSGSVTGAYRILSNTNSNCAGGATPWKTWLSCEEVSRGHVYETDPWGVKAAVQRPAMGRFKHEAAACDPVRKVVYLTEDETDGCFYRFTPTTWGDLSSGRLEVMVGGSGTSGAVTWATVPDPDGSPTATRNQVSGAKRFNGGEGCYYADGVCYFTTKGDNRVWAYDAAASTVSLTYDDSLVTSGSAPLTGVDNVTGSASGDLFVAEDGGSMDICVITPDGVVAPFLRIEGQSGSEITGPAFSPDGRRLYFSSQRGTSGSSSGGITYEVTGPFRA